MVLWMHRKKIMSLSTTIKANSIQYIMCKLKPLEKCKERVHNLAYGKNTVH